MASLDFVFQGPPPTGVGVGNIPQPGTKLAPSVGLDTLNGVGYLNAGAGWVPQAPALVAKADFTAVSATQTTQALYTVPAHMGGVYRISYEEKVTTVDGTGVSFGVFTVQFTDNTDGASASTSPNANSANTTNTTTGGIANNSVVINAQGGSAITYTLTATGTGGQARFAIHVRVELISVG